GCCRISANARRFKSGIESRVFAIQVAPSCRSQSSVRQRKLPCTRREHARFCRIGWLIAEHDRPKTIIIGGRPSMEGYHSSSITKAIIDLQLEITASAQRCGITYSERCCANDVVSVASISH